MSLCVLQKFFKPIWNNKGFEQYFICFSTNHWKALATWDYFIISNSLFQLFNHIGCLNSGYKSAWKLTPGYKCSWRFPTERSSSHAILVYAYPFLRMQPKVLVLCPESLGEICLLCAPLGVTAEALDHKDLADNPLKAKVAWTLFDQPSEAPHFELLSAFCHSFGLSRSMIYFKTQLIQLFLFFKWFLLEMEVSLPARLPNKLLFFIFIISYLVSMVIRIR